MRNRNWVFGNNAGIKFTPIPAAVATSPINTYEGCAAISDLSGNLLFYTDGETVKDPGGTVRIAGLQGNQTSTQAALIVPDPGNKRRYYVFTSQGAPSNGPAGHVKAIRMDAMNWTWTPVAAMLSPPMTGYAATERLVAVLHANLRDYWVLTVVRPPPPPPTAPPVSPGALRVFLVTGTGVSYVGDRLLKRDVGDVGYLKATRSGRYLALASFWGSTVLVIPFSNSNGTISQQNIVTINVMVPPLNTGGYPYGVEFSPSGKLLYYSTAFPLLLGSAPLATGYVFQHQLPSGPALLVGTHPNNPGSDYALGAMQMGSDGRIYIAQDGEDKLGVISQPDVPGAGCNLAFNAFQLAPGSICKSGLPNMIRDLF